MKKYLMFTMIMVIALSLLVGGCAGQPPQGDNEETAPEEEVYELVFSYFTPEVIPPSQMAQLAADRIEEKSNGRIKMTTYFGGTLVSHADSIPALASGVADIVGIDSHIISSQFELNKIFDRLIETQVPGRMEMTLVYRDLLKNVPELQMELENVGVRWLSIAALPGYNLHSVNKAVRVPDDIRGMSVEIMGDGVEWVESMGASAVSMDPGDVYMSLDRGLINGQFTHWAFIQGFQNWELFTHHTIFGDDPMASGVYAPCIGFLINLDTWNKLPKDLQDIIVEAYDWGNEYLINELDNEPFQAGYQNSFDAGHEMLILTPEERQLWIDYMVPINQAWIEATEAKGLPAEATFEELLRLIEFYHQ